MLRRKGYLRSERAGETTPQYSRFTEFTDQGSELMQLAATKKRRTSGRFASLMELYENNYMLVRLLIPELRTLDEGHYVSRVSDAMDLELSQIEHSRYTTTFNLTYRFENSLRQPREPDLTIRLYHDARTAEVVTGLIQTQRAESRRKRGLDDSWQLNRFLFKWLRYCLHQGHLFSVSDARSTAKNNGSNLLESAE